MHFLTSTQASSFLATTQLAIFPSEDLAAANLSYSDDFLKNFNNFLLFFQTHFKFSEYLN